MKELDGKTALVTGGSTGIGLATARLFAAEGATVYITGRRAAELNAAVEAIGPGAVGIRGDIDDIDDLKAVHARIAADAGHLDVLFANAGGGTRLATIAEITRTDFDTTFGINVRGTVFTVQTLLPLMSGGASIVVTGSSSAHTGVAGYGVYSASKAALRQFVRVWAAELADQAIRVNMVTPGATDTDGLRGIAADEAGAQALVDRFAASIPLGRVADPKEIAEAVLFLASDRSSFMTASEVVVDGGDIEVGRA